MEADDYLNINNELDTVAEEITMSTTTDVVMYSNSSLPSRTARDNHTHPTSHNSVSDLGYMSSVDNYWYRYST